MSKNKKEKNLEENCIWIGHLTKPYGQKGKLVLSLKRSIKIPDRIFVRFDNECKAFRIKKLKPYKNKEKTAQSTKIIISLKEVKTREEAEKIRGASVYLKLEDLPKQTKYELTSEVKPKKEIREEDIEKIGFITKPHGVHGKLAAIVRKNSDATGKIFIKEENFFQEYTVVKERIIREVEDNKYSILKINSIYNRKLAEKLRKKEIFKLK